jgi:hypothetical protein
MALDLSETPAIDAHCHPWRSAELAGLDPGGFEDRTTMMGMCQLTSSHGDDLQARVARFTDSTPFALHLRRRLAGVLDVHPTREAVAEARRRAFAEDAPGYVGRLLADARIEAVLYDEGYPQPTIAFDDFARDCPTRLHRVGRIEPWIAALREQCGSYDELEEAFERTIDQELTDPKLVAFKSVIAYRTGLDVGDPSVDDARAAFTRWRAAGFPETRADAKPVRDRLLRLTFRCAAERRLPIHIHTGGGDPDVVLRFARPAELFTLLSDFPEHPTVLIHSGNPWIEEAAYLASILPEVYLDMSVMLPWSSLAIDQKLEVLLGVAPPAKVLYGSDEASEPEVLWVSAHIARAALGRVLAKAVTDDWLTADEAAGIARAVLADNTRIVHGLPG